MEEKKGGSLPPPPPPVKPNIKRKRPDVSSLSLSTNTTAEATCMYSNHPWKTDITLVSSDNQIIHVSRNEMGKITWFSKYFDKYPDESTITINYPGESVRVWLNTFYDGAKNIVPSRHISGYIKLCMHHNMVRHMEAAVATIRTLENITDPDVFMAILNINIPSVKSLVPKLSHTVLHNKQSDLIYARLCPDHVRVLMDGTSKVHHEVVDQTIANTISSVVRIIDDACTGRSNAVVTKILETLRVRFPKQEKKKVKTYVKPSTSFFTCYHGSPLRFVAGHFIYKNFI